MQLIVFCASLKLSSGFLLFIANIFFQTNFFSKNFADSYSLSHVVDIVHKLILSVFVLLDNDRHNKTNKQTIESFA